MTESTPYPYQPPRRDHGGSTPGGRPPRPRRSAARTLVALGLGVWAVLELWLLIRLADAAGGLTVLLALVAGGVLGALVIRRAGRRAWRNLARMAQAAQAGEPVSEPADGASRSNGMAMLGGLMLMVPGLLSDAAGLLCLFPPTARLLRRGGSRLLDRGELGEAVRQARDARERTRMHRPGSRVVPGEVVRDTDDGPRQPPHGDGPPRSGGPARD